MLPPKRKRERMGVRMAARGFYATHRAFVKSHNCSIPGCLGSGVEFAHMRNAANSGQGCKPEDWYGISLCARHHREQHNLGMETFQKRYGVDLFAIAAEFAQKSPDRAMRAAMKEDGHEC